MSIRKALTNQGVVQLNSSDIPPRVVNLADATSVTFTPDTADMNTQTNTQVAGTLTVNSPGGLPVDGQKLIFRIKVTNVQTYSWNGIFRGSASVPLPSTTSNPGVGSPKTDYLTFIYNAADTKWDINSNDAGHI